METMIAGGILGVSVSGTILIARNVFRSKWLDAASELPNGTPTPPTNSPLIKDGLPSAD